MKKVKDWYQELPPDVRKKAFQNTKASRLERNATSLQKAISGSFIFHDTPEGHSYWYKIAYQSSKIE